MAKLGNIASASKRLRNQLKHRVHNLNTKQKSTLRVIGIFALVGIAAVFAANLIEVGRTIAAPPTIEELEVFSIGNAEQYGDALYVDAQKNVTTLSFYDSNYRLKKIANTGDFEEVNALTTNFSNTPDKFVPAVDDTGNTEYYSEASYMNIDVTPTGGNNVVLVMVYYNDDAAVINDITFNSDSGRGGSLTQVCQANTFDDRLAIWYLDNDSQGNIYTSEQVSLEAAFDSDFNFGSIFATNIKNVDIDALAEIYHSNCFGTGGDSVSNTVNSENGDLVVGFTITGDLFEDGKNPYNNNGSQTTVYESDNSQHGVSVVSKTATGSSTELTWGVTGNANIVTAAVTLPGIEQKVIKVQDSWSDSYDFSHSNFSASFDTGPLVGDGDQVGKIFTIFINYYSATESVASISLEKNSTTITTNMLDALGFQSSEGNYHTEIWYFPGEIPDNFDFFLSFTGNVDISSYSAAYLSGVNIDSMSNNIAWDGIVAEDPGYSIPGSTGEKIIANLIFADSDDTNTLSPDFPLNEETSGTVLNSNGFDYSLSSTDSANGTNNLYWSSSNSNASVFTAIGIRPIMPVTETDESFYRIKDGQGAFKVDSSGNYYVAANVLYANDTKGEFYVGKHNSSGVLTNTYTFNYESGALNSIWDLELDTDGNVYLAVNLSDAGIQRAKIIKLDNNLDNAVITHFEADAPDSSQIREILLDQANDTIYACGANYAGGEYNLLIGKTSMSAPGEYSNSNYQYNTSGYSSAPMEYCASLKTVGSRLIGIGVVQTGEDEVTPFAVDLVKSDLTLDGDSYESTFQSGINTSALTNYEQTLIMNKDSFKTATDNSDFWVMAYRHDNGSQLTRLTPTAGSGVSVVGDSWTDSNAYITSWEQFTNYSGGLSFAFAGRRTPAGNSYGFVGVSAQSQIGFFNIPFENQAFGSNGLNDYANDLYIQDDTIYAVGGHEDSGNQVDAVTGRFGWELGWNETGYSACLAGTDFNLHEHQYMGGDSNDVEVRIGNDCSSGNTIIAALKLQYENMDNFDFYPTGEYSEAEDKSYFYGDTNETGSTWSLYVPKELDHNRIRICPDVTDLLSIQGGCTNEEILTPFSPNVEDNDTYWIVSGLTASSYYGAMSYLEEVEVTPIDATQEEIYTYDSGASDTTSILRTFGDYVIVASGNVAGEVHIAKIRVYDNSELWNRTYYASNNSLDFIMTAIDVDSLNNVYVGARVDDTTIAGLNDDYFLLKLDQNGNIIWNKTYNGGYENGFDPLDDLEVGPDNNVVLTGIMQVTVGESWQQVQTTLKVNGNNGNELWRVVDNFGDSGHSYPGDLQIDQNGDVYVCGAGEMGGLNLRDILVWKYNGADGSEEWVYQKENLHVDENSGALEQCTTLRLINNEQQLFFAGTIQSETDPAPVVDFIFTSIDTADANLNWETIYYNGEAPVGCACSWLTNSVYDETNNQIVVSGRSRQHTPGNALAFALNRTTGGINWLNTYDAGAGMNELYADVTMYTDFNGNQHYVFVGSQDSMNDSIALVRGLNPSGGVEFTSNYDYNATAGTDTFGRRIGVDERGITYITGIGHNGTDFNSYILRYSYKVANVPAGIGLFAEVSPGIEVDLETLGYGGSFTAIIRNGGNEPIAQLEMGLLNNADWSNVTAERDGNKALVHFGDGFESTPGTLGTSYSLLIARPANAQNLVICPDALSLEEIAADCANAQLKNINDVDVSVVVMNGREYFKVDGLTGTGGLPINDASAVRDVLSRLEVGVPSDHTIEFGTTLGINSSGDTIELDFDDAYDTTNIDAGDIDLLVNGVNKTLCTGALPCSAGAGTWGIALNTSTNVFTFTAPTDAAAGEININDSIVIRIGLNASHQSAGANQIINPASVNQYETQLQITNGGIERGELEVPIIDDDTLNVNGYIDTFITFDIDTAATDTDCDAAGGANPCDSHGSSTDNAGYVVSLGEMTTSSINVSGTSVKHADAVNAAINYIWFDLSSNATGGVSVNSFSLNNALLGSSTQIPSVGAGEVEITAGSSLYGLQNRFLDAKGTTGGTVVINDDCDTDGGNGFYCSVGGSLGREIFNSANSTVDQARVQFRIGTSPGALNTTGTYTDELRFIATPNF